MDSSSEDSFAWTNASSDSSDNKTSQPTMNGNHSDMESESGSKYKKKLHKEIFSNMENGEELPKPSKRKITYEQSDSDCSEVTPKKKIKVEPESDRESHKKKRKELKSIAQDTSEEESYLHAKVKEEQKFTVPEAKKTKKHKRESESEEKALEVQLKLESQRESRNMELSSKVDSNLLEGDYDREEGMDTKKNKKKNKNSKNRRNSSETSTIMSIIEKQNPAESIAKDSVQNNNTFNTSLEYSRDEISIIEKVTSSQNHNVLSPNLGSKKDINNSKTRRDTNLADDNSQIGLARSIKKSRKSSNRIEETELETMTESIDRDYGIDSKLQKFLRKSSHLKPIVEQVQNESAFTIDDELWLIECPSEVDAGSLQGKTLKLQGKCKVKIDGHIYEGHTLPVDDRIAVITTKHNKTVVSSVPLAGIMQLRRRIPKPHLHENSVVENTVESIPFPAIKCRHPLFGYDYKTAINIPEEIKEKLNMHYDKQVPCVKKKKKHNKQKKLTTEQLDQNTLIECEEEPQLNTFKNKKKKRKISIDHEEEVTPRKKKKKQNLNSPGGWDSEKAIEQNLFNF